MSATHSPVLAGNVIFNSQHPVQLYLYPVVSVVSAIGAATGEDSLCPFEVEFVD